MTTTNFFTPNEVKLNIRLNELKKDLEEHATKEESETVESFLDWAVESRGISKELSTATIEQLTVREFLDYGENIAQHGISGGYVGFQFFNETVPFFERNRELIITWAKDFSESMGGEPSFMVTLSKFKEISFYDLTPNDLAPLFYSENRHEDDNYEGFANAMSFIVANTVCNAYSEFLYEVKNN